MSKLKRYTAGSVPMIFAAVVIAAGFIIAACSDVRSPVSPGAGIGGATAVKPVVIACPTAENPVTKDTPGKLTYCHIAGHAESDNANELELTTDVSGYLGHFDQQGNPLAGHEEDKCGPCEAPTPTPSPETSPSPGE